MPPNKRIHVKDDLGDAVALEGPARRIVSLVPSITETLVALGVGDRLVGVTNYCVHPKRVVDAIPKVGGTKGFSIEKIDALRPDLIVANKEENRRRHIDALRGKYPVFVTYPRTVAHAVEMVIALGRLTGREVAAAEIAEACDHLIASADPAVAGPKLATACMIWRAPWMAAGPDTYVSDLLGTYGFANVLDAAAGRYPETTLDALADSGVEVVLLPDEPYVFGEKDKSHVETFFRDRGRPVRVLLMDGSLLTWFGSRTLMGLEHLRRLKTTLATGG